MPRTLAQRLSYSIWIFADSLSALQSAMIAQSRRFHGLGCGQLDMRKRGKKGQKVRQRERHNMR